MRNILWVAGAVALIGSATVLAEGRPEVDHSREQVAVEKNAIELIETVEEVGRDVRYHVERMATFSSPADSHSRWSHYHHLDQIKALVNDNLRPALTRLSEIQGQLPEWKQESVDRMLASARELAADANSSYVAKASSPITPPAMNEEYRKLVAEMRTHVEALVTTSDAAHTYASAHLKASEAGLNVRK
jgi:hypothetical protein